MKTVVNVFANLSDLSDIFIFLFIHFDKIRFVNKNSMLTIMHYFYIYTDNLYFDTVMFIFNCYVFVNKNSMVHVTIMHYLYCYTDN